MQFKFGSFLTVLILFSFSGAACGSLENTSLSSESVQLPVAREAVANVYPG